MHINGIPNYDNCQCWYRWCVATVLYIGYIQFTDAWRLLGTRRQLEVMWYPSSISVIETLPNISLWTQNRYAEGRNSGRNSKYIYII
jgi:hypothetical protein